MQGGQPRVRTAEDPWRYGCADGDSEASIRLERRVGHGKPSRSWEGQTPGNLRTLVADGCLSETAACVESAWEIKPGRLGHQTTWTCGHRQTLEGFGLQPSVRAICSCAERRLGTVVNQQGLSHEYGLCIHRVETGSESRRPSAAGGCDRIRAEAGENAHC